jgi:hypothetical protein
MLETRDFEKVKSDIEREKIVIKEKILVLQN